MHARRSFPFFGGRNAPTRKVIRKATSVKDLRILSEKVVLEKVFGLTTLNCNGLACNPVTGTLAYPAGCVIVLLDSYTNTQSHIFNPEKKTLTSLAFSSDGKYLASGECGHNPCVRIWELTDTPTVVAELKGHKYAINCVAFSPNLKYLASIGDQHDMNVNIWNWKTGSKAACNKIGSKVRSVHFSENGSYLVTVGNRHVKFWYFDTEASSKLNMPTPLHGRSGILGDQKNNYFCDVVCGVGKNATNTYCITKSGKLCAFSPNRLLDRWVELRCTGANCLAANEENIFCGCSNGIIRVFDPKTLKFVCTLPRPHCLGVDIAKGLDASHMVPKNLSERYPDVLAMVLDSNGRKLTCIYNDHSMYIWDVRDVKKVGKSASYLYHSGCIWGVESYPLLEDGQNPRLPAGSFLTCSSDDTIRVWNIEDGLPSNKTFPRNIYSKELLKVVYTDDELANIQDMSGFIPGAESKTGIRCLKVSPDGQLLAAGDRSGNLRVYDLQFVDEIIKIVAHDSEVLCVEFSPPESGHRLLVTSSRDRLIHIFDLNQDFALLQTIDDHSSSITAVRFNYDNEVFQLLSCGADKNIMFHNAQMNNNGVLHFVRNTIVVGKATMYDMDIEPTRKYAATVGVDRNVRIYDIQGAKQTQCYKGSLSDDGTVIKIQLDPSGLYAATSCSDKSVCVYEFESGDCNAVMYGHSELVLGLQFTVDGSRLMSVSGDGCIFVWKLPNSFKQAILTRLQELQKPIPESFVVETDPFSSIRRTTFWVPPKDKEVGKDTTLISETFREGSSELFDETDGNDTALDYRFSVGRLPAWAKKQIVGDENDPRQPIIKEFQAPTLPAGRWGQRIGTANGGLAERLEDPSFTSARTTDTLEESLGPDGEFEYTGMDNQFLMKAKSVPNLSIAHEEIDLRQDLLCVPTVSTHTNICSVPYSSHKRERNRKDETFHLRNTSQQIDGNPGDQTDSISDQVIYPPTTQDDFDEEVASILDKQTRWSVTYVETLTTTMVDDSSSPGILFSPKNNKNNVKAKKTSRLPRQRRHSIATAPSSLNVQASGSSPKETIRTRRKSVHFGSATVIGTSTTTKPLQRKQSLPIALNDKDLFGETAPYRKSKDTRGRRRGVCHFPVGTEEEFADCYLVKSSETGFKPISESSFEVTANNLLHSPSAGDFPSPSVERKSDVSEKIAPTVQVDGQGNKRRAEDDGDTSDVDTDPVASDGEGVVSEDENESPLKHHFECLASDGEILDEKNENETPVEIDEEGKTGTFDQLSYRTSLSAKFLSRSQQTVPGTKPAGNTEGAKQMLETLSNAIEKEIKKTSKIMEDKGNHKNGQSLESERLQNHKQDMTADKEDHNDESVPRTNDQFPDDVAVGDPDEAKSPADLQKTTSDLIALFNQRSSTPAQPKEKKHRSRIQSAHSSASSTPALSPVGSPKRRHSNSPDKVVTFDLTPQGKSQVSGKSSHVANGTKLHGKEQEKGVRLRRHVRPTLNKGTRPKSLILPQPIVPEVDEDSRALSDTELEEQNESPFPLYKRNKRKLHKNITPTKSPNKTFVTQAPGSHVQREIDIDEKITREGKAFGTSTQRNVEIETPSSLQNGLSSKPSLEFMLSRNHSEQCSDKNELYLFNHTHTKPYYNSSPPERDVGLDSIEEIRSKMEETRVPTPSRTFPSTNGDTFGVIQSEGENENEEEEMEVSTEKCSSVISDLMNSFQQVSLFHNTVLGMPSSTMQQEILSMLSASYDAIETKIKNLRENYKDVSANETNSILVSSDFNNILKSIEQLHSSDGSLSSRKCVPNGEHSKTKPVINLLQTYSSVLVSLVSQRLEREKELDKEQ